MPIGNPEDISLNVLNHIGEAEFILAERIEPLSRIMSFLENSHEYFNYRISPHATIYQYQVETEKNRIDDINNILLEEAKNGRKIFIISDEGSSLFLEPGSNFKTLLINNDIEYQVLPGPNSVISAIVSGKYNALDFCFGGNYEWISETRKQSIMNSVVTGNIPTVFILRAIGLKEMIEDMSKYFNNKWFADLGINLSMKNEKHVYGNIKEIYDYIVNNKWLWEQENINKKIIITLFPNKYYDYI